VSALVIKVTSQSSRKSQFTINDPTRRDWSPVTTHEPAATLLLLTVSATVVVGLSQLTFYNTWTCCSFAACHKIHRFRFERKIGSESKCSCFYELRNVRHGPSPI